MYKQSAGKSVIIGVDKLKIKELSSLLDEFKSSIGEDYKLLSGDGDPNAKIVLIGEAPGKNEIEQGKPFVGQAGKNLDEFLKILNITRNQLYITNVVKFRPIKINKETGSISNRTPNKNEIAEFEDFLIRELSIIKPKLVISLGNVALKSVLGDSNASIGDYHGRPVEFNRGQLVGTLFPLYHPASIIYKRELKDTYIDDLHKLRQYIDENKILSYI